jgi:hypothetical protein
VRPAPPVATDVTGCAIAADDESPAAVAHSQCGDTLGADLDDEARANDAGLGIREAQLDDAVLCVLASCGSGGIDHADHTQVVGNARAPPPTNGDRLSRPFRAVHLVDPSLQIFGEARLGQDEVHARIPGVALDGDLRIAGQQEDPCP